MNTEEIVAAIALKHSGNWENIMCALNQRHDRKAEAEINGEVFNEDYELQPYLDILRKSDYSYVTILSDQYPAILKKQNMPPFVLFYYGDLSLLSNAYRLVSVVGSRECTEYGIAKTREVVKELAKEYIIVSGMARGIDTVAHQTAIEMGAKTIAVLGTGINICYPLSNKHLYEELKKNHLIISEYPGDVMPEPYFFPRRNRIIATISRGLFVAEAYARSGTLTAVMFALQANRAVMCLPYQAGLGSECNRLIRDGALMIEGGKDALEILKSEVYLS